MPVAQGGPPPARQAISVGIAAILGLLAVVFLITRFDQLGGSGGGGTIDLGRAIFPVGDAADVAEAIAADGPLLLPDTTGNDRDVWLQHVDDDPTTGWRAFAARSGPGCTVDWVADEEIFVDCDDTSYPADGAGLVQYGASVDPDGRLTINLNPLDEGT